MSQIIKPQSLHLQAYHIVKQSILDGEYKPSERIVESKVAETLGISRGPVREAIRMLIQDGLLVYNDGFVKVYKPTVTDIIEIFQCRQSLEKLAIKLAIEHFNEKLQKELEDNLQETEEFVDKGEELKRLDQQFHTIIIQASNNSHLIQLLDMIKTKIHYMRNSMVEATFYPTLLADHAQIYDLMMKKDAENAAKVLSDHIERGLNGLLELIK